MLEKRCLPQHNLMLGEPVLSLICEMNGRENGLMIWNQATYVPSTALVFTVIR
jgi:hypothetical protein